MDFFLFSFVVTSSAVAFIFVHSTDESIFLLSAVDFSVFSLFVSSFDSANHVVIELSSI